MHVSVWRPRGAGQMEVSVHFTDAPRRVRLVVFTRTPAYWCVGISQFVDRSVRDFSLHFVVVSISLRWNAARGR